MARCVFPTSSAAALQAQRGVKLGLIWSAALAVNFLAAHVLILPMYLTLLALAGAVVLHQPQTATARGARTTWVTVLVGLSLMTAATVSASSAGADVTPTPAPVTHLTTT